MDKINLPISYYAKRIADQYDYMFEIMTSDRSKERKEELLQSAVDMLSVITRNAPREFQFELVFVVAAGGVQYAHRCAAYYRDRRRKPISVHYGKEKSYTVVREIIIQEGKQDIDRTIIKELKNYMRPPCSDPMKCLKLHCECLTRLIRGAAL